jgi:hypothetical protein
MTRSSALLPTVLALSLVATACGPMEEDDPTAAPAALDGPAPLARSDSLPAGLQLATTTVSAGAVLTGTVSAGGGAVVYLGFSKSVFAGPRFVRIPSGQRSASFTLYSNPFLPAAATTSISARTQSPDPATFVAQAVTVVPQATPPAGAAPQVASATLSPATVVNGGGSTLAVTLTTPAPAEGAAILLAISNDFFFRDADLAPVVVVPPGATRLDVPIRTHLSSATATEVSEYVIANSFGGPFQGGTLLVTAR